MWDIPPVVRNKAIAVGATSWLNQLPSLIRRFEAEWEITVASVYDGGTEAFVAQVIEESGRSAVLKLLIPRRDVTAVHEITVLELAGGQGCAELYRSDAAAGALLVEQLGASLFDLQVPYRQRLGILTDAARKVWRPAPGLDLPTGATKASGLAESIEQWWIALDRPCSRQAVDYALRCASNRQAAHHDERAVVVHGDVHQWNALRSDAGYKLVDPDGLLAEPEYDLGVIMREDPVELLQASNLHDRSHWLATRTGLDETAIWEWGVVERVSTGLIATQIGLQPVGTELLHAADVVAAES